MMYVSIATKNDKSKGQQGPYFSCLDTIISWNVVLEFKGFIPKPWGTGCQGSTP